MNASDVMARNVISIAPDATVLQAARKMLEHHISGLPVVDSAGNLVGILSEGDFLRRQETRTAKTEPGRISKAAITPQIILPDPGHPARHDGLLQAVCPHPRESRL